MDHAKPCCRHITSNIVKHYSTNIMVFQRYFQGCGSLVFGHEPLNVLLRDCSPRRVEPPGQSKNILAQKRYQVCALHAPIVVHVSSEEVKALWVFHREGGRLVAPLVGGEKTLPLPDRAICEKRWRLLASDINQSGS